MARGKYGKQSKTTSLAKECALTIDMSWQQYSEPQMTKRNKWSWTCLYPCSHSEIYSFTGLHQRRIKKSSEGPLRRLKDWSIYHIRRGWETSLGLQPGEGKIQEGISSNAYWNIWRDGAKFSLFSVMFSNRSKGNIRKHFSYCNGDQVME